MIDVNGTLLLIELGMAGRADGNELLPFKRTDTWDMAWADDDPKLFVVMEKTRMYVPNTCLQFQILAVPHQ